MTQWTRVSASPTKQVSPSSLLRLCQVIHIITVWVTIEVTTINPSSKTNQTTTKNQPCTERLQESGSVGWAWWWPRLLPLWWAWRQRWTLQGTPLPRCTQCFPEDTPQAVNPGYTLFSSQISLGARQLCLLCPSQSKEIYYKTNFTIIILVHPYSVSWGNPVSHQYL